jgi:hypothetical protein
MIKKSLFFLVFCLLGFSLFAQAETTSIASGAQAQLADLLNKPAMVNPATAAPLGKNWFRLETDAHVFTDQVSLRQVAAMLLDLDNQDKFLNGRKSKLTTKVVSRGLDAVIADFVSISVGPLGIQIKTPYRASIKTIENTDSRFVLEVRQLPDDSSSNNDMKNLFATRYAEEVTINGKKYTYIRIYTIDEVNASILPGAKNTLEKNSFPVNEETLQMIIAAAKTKQL